MSSTQFSDFFDHLPLSRNDATYSVVLSAFWGPPPPTHRERHMCMLRGKNHNLNTKPPSPLPSPPRIPTSLSKRPHDMQIFTCARMCEAATAAEGVSMRGFSGATHTLHFTQPAHNYAAVPPLVTYLVCVCGRVVTVQSSPQSPKP